MFSLLFFVPIGVLIISYFISYFFIKRGANKKIVCFSQFGSFLLVSVSSLILSARNVFAASESSSSITSGNSMAFAIGMLAVALSFGFAAIASGIALASAIPAAIAATSENEKAFVKSMILAIFGEALALYGFIVAILIINNLKLIIGA